MVYRSLSEQGFWPSGRQHWGMIFNLATNMSRHYAYCQLGDPKALTHIVLYT